MIQCNLLFVTGAVIFLLCIQIVPKMVVNIATAELIYISMKISVLFINNIQNIQTICFYMVVPPS